MAASLEDILTEFWDLDQEVTDPYVLGQLAQLCQRYNIDAEKLTCEYFSFRNNTKTRINGKSIKLMRGSPTLETLVPFENEMLKPLRPAGPRKPLDPSEENGEGYYDILVDGIEEKKKELATSNEYAERIWSMQDKIMALEEQLKESLELNEERKAFAERKLKQHLELKEDCKAILKENRDMNEKIVALEEQLTKSLEFREESEAFAKRKLQEYKDIEENIIALEEQLKENIRIE